MAQTTSISSFSTTSTIQELIFKNAIHSRKLLFHNPLLPSPPPSNDSSPSQLQPRDGNTFDANVVMVLSVLLCALICSLGLNSIIRCALRCSIFRATGSSGNSPSAHVANTGIKKKALKTFPTISYTDDLKLPGLATECAICLSEFAPGERVRVLPKCHHGFHIRCIDKWLSTHSSCPTCRNCLIETCNKIVGSTSSQTATTAPSAQPQQLQPQEVVVIRIEPLQPECMIRNHEI